MWWKVCTVGSDAHEIVDIGADDDAAKKLIKEYGMKEVICESRKIMIESN